MYVPSLLLVVVSAAGVAAGCRTDDARPVDITPAYCARLEMLRVKVDSQFGLAEGNLPRIEPLPTEGEAGAPPQQPEDVSPTAAPSLPDVIACVEALHVASKAAVMVGQFADVDAFMADVQRIAGFASSPYKLLDTSIAASEVEVFTPDQWCMAGEIARVKEHLAGWRARFLSKIDEATAQCGAGADAPTAK